MLLDGGTQKPGLGGLPATAADRCSLEHLAVQRCKLRRCRAVTEASDPDPVRIDQACVYQFQDLGLYGRQDIASCGKVGIFASLPFKWRKLFGGDGRLGALDVEDQIACLCEKLDGEFIASAPTQKSPTFILGDNQRIAAARLECRWIDKIAKAADSHRIGPLQPLNSTADDHCIIGIWLEDGPALAVLQTDPVYISGPGRVFAHTQGIIVDGYASPE